MFFSLKGIVVDGADWNVERNLVTLSIWPGSYQNRREASNFEFDGAIHTIDATSLRMTGNVVAGSERLCYRSVTT